MIKLVVFDMAGTTVNENNIVYKTLHRAIEQGGYELSLETVLVHGAGKEKRQAVVDILQAVEGNAVSDLIINAIHAEFELMLDEAYGNFKPEPMPEAEQVFDQLKKRGIAVVLNTGYKRPVAERLVAELGWQEGVQFDLLVTADDVAKSRPEPDMILYAMDQLGITDAHFVAKVGDSIVDIEEGRNAGCRIYAGITTGAQSAFVLQQANPTHIFNSLDELLPLVAPID